MTKKLYTLLVRGRRKEWCFDVMVDPKFIDEWREDGLNIHELVSTVPQIIVDMGLMKIWLWLQDKGGIEL